MVAIKIIPIEEFRRLQNAEVDKYKKLQVLADMNRANTLATVKRAGSGQREAGMVEKALPLLP